MKIFNENGYLRVRFESSSEIIKLGIYINSIKIKNNEGKLNISEFFQKYKRLLFKEDVAFYGNDIKYVNNFYKRLLEHRKFLKERGMEIIKKRKIKTLKD
jgi:hypothetical protein